MIKIIVQKKIFKIKMNLLLGNKNILTIKNFFNENIC